MGIGGLGMGIGDWGLGIGDWAQSPNPKTQPHTSQLETITYFIFIFKLSFSHKLY
jgi:hypothetical protein